MSETIYTELLPLPPVSTRIVGRNIYYFSETDSTNTQALDAREDGSVFIAERQTAGRGRHGRQWHSAPGLGLWFSICLSGPLAGINYAAALAVRDAISDRVNLSVKWPNDLYIGPKKVCGILVEQRNDWFALGIGINVNHQPGDFPKLLRHRAGSLAMASGEYWNRRDLFMKLLEYLDLAVLRMRRGDCESLREEWIHACDIIGKRIRRGAVSGHVAAVDEGGALLVQTASGIRRVTSSDISLVG